MMAAICAQLRSNTDVYYRFQEKGSAVACYHGWIDVQPKAEQSLHQRQVRCRLPRILQFGPHRSQAPAGLRGGLCDQDLVCDQDPVM